MRIVSLICLAAAASAPAARAQDHSDPQDMDCAAPIQPSPARPASRDAFPRDNDPMTLTHDEEAERQARGERPRRKRDTPTSQMANYGCPGGGMP